MASWLCFLLLGLCESFALQVCQMLRMDSVILGLLLVSCQSNLPIDQVHKYSHAPAVLSVMLHTLRLSACAEARTQA